MFLLEFNFAAQIKVAESHLSSVDQKSSIDYKVDHNFPNELFNSKGAIKERWGFKLRVGDEPGDVVFIDRTVVRSFSFQVLRGKECADYHPLTEGNFHQKIKDTVLRFDGPRSQLGSSANTFIKNILIKEYGLKVGKCYMAEGGKVKKEDWLKVQAEAEASKN